MRRAEPIAGLGGLILLAAIVAGGLGVTGVPLVLLALLAIAVPVVSLTTRGPAKSVGTAVLASAFGWLAVVLAAARLLDGADTADWVALAGALLGWVGSWLSLRDESTPGAVAPQVPRRPVPPAAA